ncbi:50S ribosomal protein L10 [Bariatricus sp. SGI.154]|uniref:50S ribosomal protein L10 n=1 Tax=Bariatricus sp. SGI.154 TaxID=3420549 RepID=UPI003D090210
MAKVELKQPIVQAIADDVKDAASVVLVDYRGLTVAQDTELRKQLREAGIIYKVCKNTMMKRAFEGTEFAALDEHLEGPSAIAISKDDATAPARILCKFAKDAKALELKAGVVEGAVYDVAGLTELSKVPSREELLSKLLGSLQSPITNLARVLNQIAEQGGAEACEAAAPAEEAPAEEAAEAPAEA